MAKGLLYRCCCDNTMARSLYYIVKGVQSTYQKRKSRDLYNCSGERGKRPKVIHSVCKWEEWMRGRMFGHCCCSAEVSNICYMATHGVVSSQPAPGGDGGGFGEGNEV